MPVKGEGEEDGKVRPAGVPTADRLQVEACRASDVFEAQSTPKIEPGDYKPRGGTALLDACCLTIDRLGERLANTPVKERPDGVLVVIVTDGQENASKVFKKDDLNKRISHQQSKYDWKFLFLGANIDAFAVGHSYGVPAVNNFMWQDSKEGTESLYRSVGVAVRSWRKGEKLEMKADDKAS